MYTVKKMGVEFNVDEKKISRSPEFWEKVTNDSWEPETFKIFNKFADKQHSIIDIGAWIGPTTLFASQLSKKVYSLEPDRVANTILQDNLMLNPQIDNVELFNEAITDNDGTVKIGNWHCEGNSLSSTLFADGNSWECPSSRLETFFVKNKIEDCNFIKIDVEGGEIAILSDATNFLKTLEHTLFLSVHVPFFKSPKEDLAKIVDVLGDVYNYFYLEGGLECQLAELLVEEGFFSVVASKVKLVSKW